MNLMQTHGPAMVFIGVIIESLIIPIPSPLIIMGAGALLIPIGQPYPVTIFHIVYKIIIPGSIASTLGAYFPFAIAYWGGRPIVNRFQRFLGFSWNDILWMEKNLEGRVNGMLFFKSAPHDSALPYIGCCWCYSDTIYGFCCLDLFRDHSPVFDT